MEQNEYKQMYEMENTYWWYKVLHELVEGIIKKSGRKNLKILDIGCGTGKMMEILQPYGDIEGFDYSQDALNFTKKRGITNVKLLDVNDWSPEEATYDIIISLDVLYSEGIRDDYGIIRQIYRALRPQGNLIINLPAFEILKRYHDVRVFGKKRYHKKEMKDKLENMGFKNNMITYRLPLLFLIIFCKKMLEKFTNFNVSDSDLKPLPKWLNGLFLFLGRLENRLLFKNFTMPFGSSLFVVAKRI